MSSPIKGTFVGRICGVKRDLAKSTEEKNEHGGYTYRSVKIGEETADIEVYVDVAALVQALGVKAMRSKSRRSKLQEGAVTLVACNIKSEVRS